MNRIEDIRFLQEPLKVCRGSDGDIGKVCVNDVCRVMKRVSFIGDGTAARKCPSAWRVDERHPRDIYADFGEVVRFVQWIAGGSKVLESTGRELLRHLQASRPAVSPPPDASPGEGEDGESIVLEYSGNRFTMKMSDGRYMVNATEMARPFEKRPTVWLKLTETHKLRRALADDGICRSVEGQVITTRGPMGATWLEIHLWTQFAQWLSPAFASWCSARLVTMMRGETADESPDVQNEREQNDLMPVRTESFLPLPANYEEALSVIDLQQETIQQQNESLRLNRHKVRHYEETIETREWFSTTMIANELGVSAVRLNHFLSDEGLQHRVRDEWVIDPRFRHLRDIHFYEWFNHKTNYTNKYKIDSWTPAGREYILELWKKNNG